MSVKTATNSIPKAIKASLVLSRIPIVTPELNALESKYFQYQSELERRLMWTFPSYFYFKKGTLTERRFQSAQKGVISKQPGVWFPKGVPDVKHNRERSQKQEIVLPKDTSEASLNSDVSRPIVPNSRITKADEKNDISSLERKLDRTLYLLVKDGKENWVLPNFPVEAVNSEEKKALHETAEIGLRRIGGEDINTWTVSNTPAGVIQSDKDLQFLFKSHIVAGEFKLKDKRSIKDFAWLTKDEIKTKVNEEYFKEIQYLLADN
ncbi:54S ribosomal protein L17 [Kluyveromyces marxianus]|nr:54S ribosomal protein L17 [Kluyveromyces marxianus]